MISTHSSGRATTEVLVVGSGPGGAAAAAWAARAGHQVLLTDMATFPRDKTCGDGLTPRAIAELRRLGLDEWLREHNMIDGVHLYGWGHDAELPWPTGRFPAAGGAIARTELDDRIRAVAVADGATMREGVKAVDATVVDGTVTSVTFESSEGPLVVECSHLIVADGVRSGLGKILGRQWHRNTAYGTAIRAYIETTLPTSRWMTTHFDMNDADGQPIPGYGWLFPLGDSRGTDTEGPARRLINIGVGAIATEKRPAKIPLRSALEHYTSLMRDEHGLVGEPMSVRSALLPMGGAVSGVAGRNWVLIGDAAGCVNPLNGEGIDYALEGGRLAVDNLHRDDLPTAWPTLLQDNFGDMFSAARRFATLFTIPGVVPMMGRPAFRSRKFLDVSLRMMGNLVHHDDTDVVARLAHGMGRTSRRLERREPFA